MLYPLSKMFCSLIGQEYIMWLRIVLPETLKDAIVLSGEK